MIKNVSDFISGKEKAKGLIDASVEGAAGGKNPDQYDGAGLMTFPPGFSQISPIKFNMDNGMGGAYQKQKHPHKKHGGSTKAQAQSLPQQPPQGYAFPGTQLPGYPVDPLQQPFTPLWVSAGSEYIVPGCSGYN